MTLPPIPLILARDFDDAIEWAREQGIGFHTRIWHPIHTHLAAGCDEVLETDRFGENPYADEMRQAVDSVRRRQSSTVTISRDEYEKLTADHAEVADLRARNERQKRGIRQLGDELGRERRNRNHPCSVLKLDITNTEAHKVVRRQLADARRAVDALIEQSNADAELIGRLVKERNEARDNARRIADEARN